MQEHFERWCDVLKKRLTEQEIRWGVGFVTVMLALTAFCFIVGFMGGIELCRTSIVYGTVGAVVSLIFFFLFCYIAYICLYDCKF